MAQIGLGSSVASGGIPLQKQLDFGCEQSVSVATLVGCAEYRSILPRRR
jgi:hypothetical protein